ncbi:MAG: hypothetical protein ACI9ZH_000768 [Paracoccaceae bacterium]|jgi:hypothetical protein
MFRPILIVAALALAAPAAARPVSFDDAWTEQRFSLFSSNDFGLGGDTLSVRSDGTVSLVWAPVAGASQGARHAAWSWAVDRSVAPTDLTLKGGDDRDLSVYFVFLPPEAAAKAAGRGIKALLDDPDARVLTYVWGGAHARGEILHSPYLGPRGRTVILRPAGPGEAQESIDLARDHMAAFGTAPGSLVGLAVSADSDDTDGVIVARLSDLTIE